MEPNNPTEIRFAHWATPYYLDKRTGRAYTFECSHCGQDVYMPRQMTIEEMGYAFCPHCGAKMDEEEDE